MRYIVILLMAIFWWFLVGMGMNFLLLDDVLLTNAGLSGSANYTALNTDTINFSAETIGEDTGISNIKTGLKFLFGFRITENVFEVPNLIRDILSFMNWLILIITLISVLKVVNIIHNG